MYYIQPYIKLVGDTDVCVFDIPIPCTNMIDRLCFACFPLTVNMFSLIRFVYFLSPTA